jgi:two-component system, NtrC family, nitrogen regulation sensor histidine kinase NtrY
MNLSRTGLNIASHISKRRYRYIVFFIIVLLFLMEGVRSFTVADIERNWESVREKRATREAEIVTDRFGRIQTRVATIARRAAAKIGEELPLDFPNDRLRLFQILETIAIDDLQGIDVIAADGRFVAWWGKIHRSGFQPPANNENADTFSLVQEGAVFTTLTVIVPLVFDGAPVAYVAASESFDVQYALSRRFVRIEGLRRELRSLLGKPVTVRFDTGYPVSDNEIHIPLRGVNSSLLGYAVTAPPSLEAHLTDVEESFRDIRSFLIIGLTGFLLFGLIRWVRGYRHPIPITLFGILLIWVVRYVWYFFNIPAELIGGTPFDPAYYASHHGGGIVASPGDLLITAVFLIMTALLLFHSVVMNNSLGVPKQMNPRHRWWVIPTTVLIFSAHMGLIRSYAASVRSLVFDSSIRFTEMGSLIPSPMLAMMQLNLLLLTAAFILFGTVLGFLALRIVQSAFPGPVYRYGVPLFMLLVPVSAGFYLIQSTPLIGWWYYASVPSLLIGTTILVQSGYLQSFRLYKIRSILYLTGLSVLFAVPVLDKKVHDFDREQIQFIASNIVRPTDTWKEFVLHQSLNDFRNDGVLIRNLREDDREFLDRAAFHLWAGSMLGSEGYNTSIVIYDRDGAVMSAFGIGFQPPEEIVKDIREAILGTGDTYIRDIETLYGTATLYGADTRIEGVDNELLATVLVYVITGPGTLFRGYGPDIIRAQISPDIAARYGQMIISEFRGRSLVSTTAPDFPSTHTIPEPAYDRLRENESQFIWVREVVSESTYETVYFHGQYRDMDTYLAISVPFVDLRWHVFYVLKLVFFAVSVSVLILVLAGIVFYAQGKRYQPTFREKILIGLLSISLIPIVLVAYLNRDFTIEQMTANISRQLRDETERVAVQLERYADVDFLDEAGTERQPIVERIAGEIGVDFILYADGVMLTSSRMEMFEAELMDIRLSGFAYASIVLEGKNFITREEAIGQSAYLVGYRPIYTDGGRHAGVLAVPAIYRQDEIDEELARRDAFLFGIYGVVILSVILTGLLVANRMARPIERLTDATNRVAGGELDIELETKGDTEISNLMRSFTVMTKRLKESREELARYERELAWREMARQVAHEIKNPLTPMKLSIQQLRQARKDRSKEFDTSFDRITTMLLEQIASLDRIASEFSHFARMPVPYFEPTRINEVLKRALHIFPGKSNVDFKLNFDDTIPEIDADPDELQRAFVNIFRNSMQAMPKGGTLEVLSRLRDDTVEIQITDTGTGIPPEAHARMFEPNFSTKTDGMGLGLAIVKKTINELNGTIEIRSEENVGTTVLITIPLQFQSDRTTRKDML